MTSTGPHLFGNRCAPGTALMAYSVMSFHPPPILGADVCPYSRWGHEAREVGTLTQGPAGRKLRQENPSRHLRSMPLALLLG